MKAAISQKFRVLAPPLRTQVPAFLKAYGAIQSLKTSRFKRELEFLWLYLMACQRPGLPFSQQAKSVLKALNLALQLWHLTWGKSTPSPLLQLLKDNLTEPYTHQLPALHGLAPSTAGSRVPTTNNTLFFISVKCETSS